MVEELLGFPTSNRSWVKPSVQPPFSYSYNPQSSSTIGYKHYYFGGAAGPLKYLGEEIRNGPPRPQVESAANTTAITT